MSPGQRERHPCGHQTVPCHACQPHALASPDASSLLSRRKSQKDKRMVGDEFADHRARAGRPCAEQGHRPFGLDFRDPAHRRKAPRPSGRQLGIEAAARAPSPIPQLKLLRGSFVDSDAVGGDTTDGPHGPGGQRLRWNYLEEAARTPTSRLPTKPAQAPRSLVPPGVRSVLYNSVTRTGLRSDHHRRDAGHPADLVPVLTPGHQQSALHR